MSRESKKMMENPAPQIASLQRHRAMLAILLLVEGMFYLLGTGFAWLIVLSLSGAGYGFGEMRHPALLILSVVTVIGGLLPPFAAYALLRKHAWAKASVLLAGFGALALAVVLSLLIMQHPLTRNRLILIALQSGLSITLSLYAFWFVRRRKS